MSNITIIGAGRAGRALVEEIKAKDANCNIRLIDKDNYYFSRADIISTPGDISKRINLSEWAESNKVDFVNDKVEKINLKRKKIYLKNNEPLEFEKLTVASGLVSKKLGIKGEQKEGVFYLGRIDAFKLKDLLKISPDATVYVSTGLGIRLVLSLASQGKEVRVVASNLDFLAEHKEKTIDSLKQRSVIFHLNSSIEEIVGEGMVKAVKISPLKVFSSQIVFIDSGFIPNMKFFEEEVKVRDGSFCDYEGIQFVGSVVKDNGG